MDASFLMHAFNSCSGHNVPSIRWAYYYRVTATREFGKQPASLYGVQYDRRAAVFPSLCSSDGVYCDDNELITALHSTFTELQRCVTSHWAGSLVFPRRKCHDSMTS